MEWNKFKFKLEILCLTKKIKLDELKTWKYVDVVNEMKRLNILY